MLKIDKSLFTAEELAQYEALIAKAKVDTEADDNLEKGCGSGGCGSKEMDKGCGSKKKGCKTQKEDDMMDNEGMEDEEMDKGCKTKKSAPSPEIQAALKRLENLEKSYDMKECLEVAKKYAPLGEKEEELANTLYEMKKSNEANYNSYIAVLDKSLAIVEKSGVFSEIGKSAGGSVATSAEGKIEAKAAAIMKADPKIDRTTAIAKAWEQSPDLMAEYDKEYHR